MSGVSLLSEGDSQRASRRDAAGPQTHRAQEAGVRNSPSISVILSVVGLGAAMASCAQNSRSAGPSVENAPVTTGLAAMERGDSPTPRAQTPDPNATIDPNSIEGMAQRSAIDLERALAASPSRGVSDGHTAPASTEPGPQHNTDPAGRASADDASGVSVGLVQVDRQATQGGGSDATPTGPDAGTSGDASGGAGVSAGLGSLATLDERIAGARDELMRLLAERASGATTPVGDLAMAAALAADAGAPAPEIATLAPSEAAAVRAIYSVHGAVRSVGSTESGGVTVDAADALQSAADAASASLALRITDAKLCTRVVGFGDYADLGVNAFLAGRANPVIVYTQVDRFASHPASGERQVVELSQELNIYHDSDGAHCWKRPPETVTESTRTRRRDFFLTNAIELPSTLTVGRYRLKVTMRDLTSSSVAETTIPFSIVADPTLAHTAE